MYDSWWRYTSRLGATCNSLAVLSCIQHGYLRSRNPFLFGTRAVCLPMIHLFAGRDGPGVLLLVSLGPVASWFAFEAFTLVGLNGHRGIVELPGPSWLSWSHKAWLTATAISFAWAPWPAFLYWFSSFLILILITKYPKCHLYELGQ